MIGLKIALGITYFVCLVSFISALSVGHAWQALVVLIVGMIAFCIWGHIVFKEKGLLK